MAILRHRVTVLVVAIACAVLVGCGTTEWSRLTVEAGYQPPNRLNVTVLAISRRDDWKEAVDTFTTALRHELKSKGIDASFGSAPPDGPLAELKATEWELVPPGHFNVFGGCSVDLTPEIT